MHCCDVVIIDSGVDLSVIQDVSGICINKKETGYEITDDISDIVGHGTIISSIIRKQAPSSNIFVIKLNDDTGDSGIEILIEALKYINENIDCRLVNISCGINANNEINELYESCLVLYRKGVVIVSAYDNDGCFSYPAVFDCVVGVDSQPYFDKITEYDYVENSPINIFSKGKLQRLKIKDEKTLLVGGSSISCAYIVANLAKELDKYNDFNSALNLLKNTARIIYEDSRTKNKSDNIIFPIANAVVFPFSKEAHAFLRFNDMLAFAVKGFYDVRQSGKVDRKLKNFYENIESDDKIRDIEKIDFEGIDTLILGHLDELNVLSKCDYRKWLIEKAIQNKINIISFDQLGQYTERLRNFGIKYYYPQITAEDVPGHFFGKLFKIPRPVVGIFGTSSQQGKFSLQLALKRELESREYNVGTIGTEPHSLLFGMDVVFPMGYNSTVQLSNHEVVIYLNNEINKLCTKGKEIIIGASQAQTIPYYCNNLLEYPSLQFHYALGLKPDAIVLCINYFDDLDYISNTVDTLQGLTDAKVIAFVMYPLTYMNEWSTMKRRVTIEEYAKKRSSLYEKFETPVYFMGEDTANELANNIIDFF